MGRSFPQAAGPPVSLGKKRNMGLADGSRVLAKRPRLEKITIPFADVDGAVPSSRA